MTADAQLAYLIFWAIYLFAFAVFFWMASKLFKLLPLYGLRSLLKVVLAVVLLTPVASTEAADWWIPAWLHGGYEQILGNAAEAARAWFNMGIAAAVLLLIWILDLLRHRLAKRK